VPDTAVRGDGEAPRARARIGERHLGELCGLRIEVPEFVRPEERDPECAVGMTLETIRQRARRRRVPRLPLARLRIERAVLVRLLRREPDLPLVPEGRMGITNAGGWELGDRAGLRVES